MNIIKYTRAVTPPIIQNLKNSINLKWNLLKYYVNFLAVIKILIPKGSCIWLKILDSKFIKKCSNLLDAVMDACLFTKEFFLLCNNLLNNFMTKKAGKTIKPKCVYTWSGR